MVDPVTEIARESARQMLMAAVKAASFVTLSAKSFCPTVASGSCVTVPGRSG